MNPKYTPGPWSVKFELDRRHRMFPIMAPFEHDESAPHHPLLAQVSVGRGSVPEEIAKANATLIAASPEMADFINRICTFTGYTHEIFGVEDSIADAERFSALMEEGRNLIARIIQ